jgi:hypothetical protein
MEHQEVSSLHGLGRLENSPTYGRQLTWTEVLDVTLADGGRCGLATGCSSHRTRRLDTQPMSTDCIASGDDDSSLYQRMVLASYTDEEK